MANIIDIAAFFVYRKVHIGTVGNFGAADPRTAFNIYNRSGFALGRDIKAIVFALAVASLKLFCGFIFFIGGENARNIINNIRKRFARLARNVLAAVDNILLADLFKLVCNGKSLVIVTAEANRAVVRHNNGF